MNIPTAKGSAFSVGKRLKGQDLESKEVKTPILVMEENRYPDLKRTESTVRFRLEPLRKASQTDQVETYLNELLARGDYADDVTPEELVAHDAAVKDYLEGRDRGITAEELKAELFGQQA